MNAIPPRHDGPLAARDRVSRGHDVLSRLFAKAFHKVLDRIDTGLEHGALEAWLPDGTTRILGGRQPGPVCEVHLHSWRALVRLGLSGSAGWYRAWAQGLGDLLARRPGQAATWLSWLRNAPQSPAERNILRLIGRLAYPARSNIQRGSGCQPAQHEHLCSRSRRQDRGGRAGED